MRRGRWSLAVVPILLATACRKPAPPVPPGDPLPGLDQAQRDQFDRGKVIFNRRFTPETGLGPLFNATGCGECHEKPAAGGVGDEVEVHATAFLANGVCDHLADLGGFVYQQEVTPALKAALGIDKEPIPAKATGQGRRSSPAIFGFGLLDAVPDSEILAYADPDDRDHDGISGRPNYFLDGRLGRFGRKALVPTLREFNEGAFPVEIGITVPSAPNEETVAGQPIPPGVDPVPDPELDAESVALTNAFVRFLAPPSPPRLQGASRRGPELFEKVGCAACHRPRLRTGDSDVKALAHREVAAYTDLLLHDMGPALADICLGQATPSEFRTAPLMGLRFSEKFLHDGRAATIEEAIRLHAGEAAASQSRFAGLPQAEREALLAFLKQL